MLPPILLLAICSFIITLKVPYASGSCLLLEPNPLCVPSMPAGLCLLYSGTNICLAGTNGTDPAAPRTIVGSANILYIRGLGSQNNSSSVDVALLTTWRDRQSVEVRLGLFSPGQLILEPNSTLGFENLVLTQVDVSACGLAAADLGHLPTEEIAFLQLEPAALTMNKGSALIMHNVTMPMPCDTVLAHIDYACSQAAPADVFEVGLGWAFVKALSVHRNGSTITLGSTNITCIADASHATTQPCLSNGVDTATAMIEMISTEATSSWAARLNEVAAKGVMYITLAGDILLKDPTNATRASLATVDGFTLVLRSAASPRLVNLGALPGSILLPGPFSYTTPATSSSSSSSSSSNTSSGTGRSSAAGADFLAAGVLRLEGLVLHNLPPGPPSLYPYSLLTALLWSFDFDRRISTGATAGCAAATTQLELVNCTIVVPDGELKMWASWVGVSSNDPAQWPAPQDWLFSTLLSEVQVSDSLWSNSMLTVESRLISVTFGLLQGLCGTWSMANVTFLGATNAVAGQVLQAYGSPGGAAVWPVTTLRNYIISDESNVSQVVVLRESDKLSPGYLDPSKGVRLRATGDISYRLLLLDDTQVDADGWAQNTVQMPYGGSWVLVAGDPVNTSRVHLDLQGVTVAISCPVQLLSYGAQDNYLQLNSLVLINAGPLPQLFCTDSGPTQYSPPPSPNKALPPTLTCKQRAALANFTSVLWFFDLAQSPDPRYKGGLYADRILLLRNVTLVLPDLEVQALVELASAGFTAVNIPPLAEAALASRLRSSTVPQPLRHPPGSFFFSVFTHFQYFGLDITLAPASTYAPLSPFPLIYGAASSSSQLTPPGQPVYKRSGSPSPSNSSFPFNGSSHGVHIVDLPPAADQPRVSMQAALAGSISAAACVVLGVAACMILHWRRTTGSRSESDGTSQPKLKECSAGVGIGANDVDASPAGTCTVTCTASRLSEMWPMYTDIELAGFPNLHGPYVSQASLPPLLAAAACPGTPPLAQPVRAGAGAHTTLWQARARSQEQAAQAEQSAHQQSAHQQSAHQQSAHQQSAHQQSAHAEVCQQPQQQQQHLLERGWQGLRPWTAVLCPIRLQTQELEPGRRTGVLSIAPGVGVQAGQQCDDPQAVRASGVAFECCQQGPTDAPAAAAPAAPQQLPFMFSMWDRGQRVVRPVDSASSSRDARPCTPAALPGDSKLEGAAAPAGQLLRDMRSSLGLLLRSGDDLIDLEVDGVLGQGNFGTVFRGNWKGVQVAVKRLVLQQMSPGGGRQGSLQQSIMQEVAINASLVHKNIVATYGFWLKPLMAESTNVDKDPGPGSRPSSTNDWQLLLVQELCSEGTLYEALLGHRFFDKSARLPRMEQVLEICIDIFNGLGYIHDRRLVHADVKPDNILLSVGTSSSPQGKELPHQQRQQQQQLAGDGGSGGSASGPAGEGRGKVVAKLADFGLSVLLNAGHSHISGIKHGTPLYVAPEVIFNTQASEASDVYAAGVVMWELYHGRSAWNQLTNLVRTWRSPPANIYLVPGLFTFEDHHTAPEFERLIAACLDHDVRKRPTAHDCSSTLRHMLLQLNKVDVGR